MNERLFVVETEDNIFLGRVEFKDGFLIIRTGLQGHPAYVLEDDVVELTQAWLHPDVEYIKAV